MAVNAGAFAAPVLSVTTDTVVTPPGNVPPAPLPAAVTLKVTVTFGSKFPAVSVTFAAKVVWNGVFTEALCGVPPTAVTDTGGPRFVSRKLAWPSTPFGPVAVTAYDPAIALAVKTGAMATPFESVVMVAAPTPPVNVPVGALEMAGATKVTA